MKKFELDMEAVDSITLGNLKNQRKYLKNELKRWKENPKTDINPDGYWLHDEDVVYNKKLVKALDIIIAYYGGDV